MKNQYRTLAGIAAATILVGAVAQAASTDPVSDDIVSGQRDMLAKSTMGAGFGPQSPRDIGSMTGSNTRMFQTAPAHTAMNLCNIHFHESAEHKGPDFSAYRGNGDGKGHGTGFVYSGELTAAELAPTSGDIGANEHGSLEPGDTIEVHYVHSTAQVVPGPTLGACLSDAIKNPQLRVETQVYVLVNDADALDFNELAAIGEVDGYQQAIGIPSDTGSPIQYAGSTTGPSYNEVGSPFQVSWSVRPQIAKVDINTVGAWLGNNVFDETYAHAVRNLVTNPELLSTIGK